MKNDELCNRKDKMGKKRKVEKIFIVLFYHNPYNHSNWVKKLKKEKNQKTEAEKSGKVRKIERK